MIIGNGILARAFKADDSNWDNMVVVAAGVANSSETRESEFERELKLLQGIDKSNGPIVYFSTVSINDATKKDSPYVIHKLRMESYIQENFEQYLIARLPIVVSTDSNANQLFGYLKSQVELGGSITVYSKASRYLIKVEDVPKAVALIWRSELAEKGNIQKVMNVGFSKKLSMMEIADIIKGQRPDVQLSEVYGGDSYDVDFSEFESLDTRGAGIESDPLEIVKSFLDRL